jgi:hypothetical protein
MTLLGFNVFYFLKGIRDKFDGLGNDFLTITVQFLPFTNQYQVSYQTADSSISVIKWVNGY